MTQWPNWVDFIVLTIIFRTCYSGFGRGLLTEFFTLAGAVSVTALSVNYAGLVTSVVRQWVSWLDPTIAAVVIFWAIFFGLLFAVHQVVKWLATFIKWERLHWFIQGIGIALGALRGLWWSGFLLLVFVSSGLMYLKASVEERSILGPRLVGLSRESLERVANQFPGAEHRGESLVPPVKKPVAAR